MAAQALSRQRAVGTAAAAPARTGLSPLLIITVICLILPVNFTIGSLYLTPSRVLFMFTTPILFLMWANGRFGKPLVVDWFIMLYMGWFALAYTIHHPDQAVTFVPLTIFILLGGYLTARATIRSTAQFISLAKLFAFLVVLCLPAAVYEAVTGDIFIVPYIEALGLGSIRDVNYCCRFGLDRAQVFTVHPIHFGIFASLPLAVYFLGCANHISIFFRSIVVVLVGITCFMSVSSGPFFSMLFQVMLVTYAVIFRNRETLWRDLLIVSAVGYTILELLTTHFAFYAIAFRLAFNPATAGMRNAILTYGIDQVAVTPFFGIGWRCPPTFQWWMTCSVDNFWLVTPIQYGLPALVGVAGAFLWSMFKSGGGFARGSDAYNVRVSWTILLVSLSLSLATVTIWSEVQSMVFLFLGAGQFLFYGVANDSAPAPEPDATPTSRFTRFAGPPRGRTGAGALARTGTAPAAPIKATAVPTAASGERERVPFTRTLRKT